jgi:hypothetical protein
MIAVQGAQDIASPHALPDFKGMMQRGVGCYRVSLFLPAGAREHESLAKVFGVDFLDVSRAWRRDGDLMRSL